MAEVYEVRNAVRLPVGVYPRLVSVDILPSRLHEVVHGHEPRTDVRDRVEVCRCLLVALLKDRLVGIGLKRGYVGLLSRRLDGSRGVEAVVAHHLDGGVDPAICQGDGDQVQPKTAVEDRVGKIWNIVSSEALSEQVYWVVLQHRQLAFSEQSVEELHKVNRGLRGVGDTKVC